MSSQITIGDLQLLCERGQRQLMEMRYLEAERSLAQAEAIAWQARDLETLSRLYMPLQECRRQRRQRCGEGIVCLDLLAESREDQLEARHVLENFPHGQLLVAGWASIKPALQVREMAAAYEMYVETFLAAVYPIEGGSAADRIIALIALEDAKLPAPDSQPLETLRKKLPAHTILLRPEELPAGQRQADSETYGQVMALWERLHLPFLQAADRQTGVIEKIEAYRKTIRVDYASELAHQKLSDAARLASKSPS